MPRWQVAQMWLGGFLRQRPYGRSCILMRSGTVIPRQLASLLSTFTNESRGKLANQIFNLPREHTKDLSRYNDGPFGHVAIYGSEINDFRSLLTL